MSVSITTALHQELRAAGLDPENFVRQFALWKAAWPKNEYSFELFGKDGAYVKPEVSGQPYGLRHVHLMPVPDSPDLDGWKKAFRRLGRKTSDRHLVYAQNKAGDFLLIFILDEPTAHDVAQMRTTGDKSLMKSFANVAENFIEFGDTP